jgi:hypothetical protein
MLANTLVLLLCTGAVLLVVMALLAPLESLRWWAGWSDQASSQLVPAPADRPPPVQPAEHYVVWLAGIGSLSWEVLTPLQQAFLDRLAARVPGARLVSDAFAYSVRNDPLTGHRALAWLWRYIQRRERKRPGDPLGLLVELHNALQLAVSADARYGPIYNLGLARSIRARLVAHGYAAGPPRPLTLIGYSGGGQVAVGAAWFLRAWTGAPVRVISIGGVIAPDRGLEAVEQVYQLQGSRDRVSQLAALAFPGRWPPLRYSSWNRAVAAGKVTVIPTGPMTHTGPTGYFGPANVGRVARLAADLIVNGPVPVLSYDGRPAPKA